MKRKQSKQTSLRSTNIPTMHDSRAVTYVSPMVCAYYLFLNITSDYPLCSLIMPKRKVFYLECQSEAL